MKKLIMIILTFTLIIGLSVAGASAKVKKPGKVTGIKASKTSCEITLTWKKAKRAKKYQISQYIDEIGEDDIVKTTSKRKVKVPYLVPNKKYYFKIRGIKGKKKGKWSKVKVRTKSPVMHKGIYNTKNIKGKKFIIGDKYTIQFGKEKFVVRVEEFRNEKNMYIELSGETTSGGTFHYYLDEFSRGIKDRESVLYKADNSSDYFCWDGLNTYVDINGNVIEPSPNDNEDPFDKYGYVINVWAKAFLIKDNSTAAYWTLDGVEPQKGQSDLVGYSKYCSLDVANGPITEWFLEAQEIVNKYELKEGRYPKTKLRGTVKKGRTLVWTEPHGDDNYLWFKVYNKGKLIYERMNYEKIRY